MLTKIIGMIILIVLIMVFILVDESTVYYSECYRAEEYSGHAVFGNCSGKKGEDHCKKCRYYCDVNNQE